MKHPFVIPPMHRLLLLVLVSVFNLNSLTAQVEQKFIQVNGEAELELVPDQIFVTVHMEERFENREKLTIEQQETMLLEALKEGGLDPEAVSLSDSRASFVKIPWSTRKDVMASADYEILVASAEEAALIFEAVDSLNIASCYISKVDHSQREEFERQVRVDAMKDAGDRASYMLEAVGQQRGPLHYASEIQHQVIGQRQQFMLYERNAYAESSVKKEKFNVSFKKIKLHCVVNAKFGIE